MIGHNAISYRYDMNRREKIAAHYLPQINRAAEHLANERTFLAWIMTSIAVVSFGFVTGKLSVMLPFLTEQPAVVMGGE